MTKQSTSAVASSKKGKSIAAMAAKSHPCCAVAKCADQGCKLILPNAKGAVTCISGDEHNVHHGVKGKLADCVIFWAGSAYQLVVAAELKTGAIDAKQVREQLQQGAKLAEVVVGKAKEVEFLPLLVHLKMSQAESQILNKMSIKFLNVNYPISRVHCGQSVLDALAKADLPKQ